MKRINDKNSTEKSFSAKLIQSLLIATILSPVYADDTEIFYTESEVNSNVLFVMDNSGSMRETVDGTYTVEDVEITSSIVSDEDDAEEYIVDESEVAAGVGDSENHTHAITDYLEMTKTDDVSNAWKSLVLTNNYTNPVVACTYNLPSDSDNEGAVRVQIASENDIQIRVQRPLNGAVTASSVYCTVSEEGSYTTPIKYEAHTVTSTDTNKKTKWQSSRMENVTSSKAQNYSNPVITGQVMTYNNPNFVAFWSSKCNTQNPATNAAICVGKHTGESPNNGDTTETLGYFIAETASYTLPNAFVKIALGSDSIKGVKNERGNYSLPRSYTYATATISAMDGQDGGWAVLYGETPVSGQLKLAIDEDTVGDGERDHTTEQVAYWVMAPNVSGSLSNNTNAYSSDIEMIQEDGEQVVGFRFTSIDVPKDSVISSAYIQFTADDDAGDVSSDASNLNIRIQSHDNPPAFEDGVESNIADRALYSAPVNWNPPAWNTPGEQNNAQKTPDLTSLIQLVVNRDGWAEGNAAVFVISGSGKRSAQSYDNDGGSGAAVLYVNYETDGTEEKTRMQVMQDALKIVLAEAPNNLSVGIMNYGDTTGGRRNHPNGVKFPVKAITMLARPLVEESIKIDGLPNWALNNIPEPSDTVTVRTFLSEIADSWEPRGMTPIVDALYEATLYYRGEPLWRGFNKATRKYAAHPATYATVGPPLVEAIDNMYNSGACDATPYNKTIWGLDNIAEWRSGDTWGYKCPADVSNPSNGATANCAATENSCNLNHSTCNSGWVGGYTDYNDCTGTDEDGNPTGCTWHPAYCPNDDWGPIGSNGYCKYKVCQDAKMDPPEYISPAIADCQSNNIVLMSDGKPEYLTNRQPYAESKIESFISTQCVNSPEGFKAGRCGPELTHYIADNDINLGLTGDQTVDTFVIGFSSGISDEAALYLESLVTLEDDPETEDKEGYFSAQNEEELAAAFAQVLDEIAEEARSQASPGYSVNVKSGLEHEDDIYIPVFDKTSGSRWSGNLKKFKLVEENDSRYIRGKVSTAGNADATGYINAMTELGLFKDDAWDEWSESAVPDGNNVEKGGTASLLDDPRDRNLYTNVAPGQNLSHPHNQLKASNNRIRNEMLFDRNDLGLSVANANQYRKKLVNFIRGWIGGNDGGWGDGAGNGFPEGNIPAKSRKHMGDMLHSEPVVITYKQGDADGDGKEQYIFAATNEGYLHVFDSTSGEEKFAFMPQELLKNINGQFTQEGDHVYGIDGSISYFIENDNHNGSVDEATQGNPGETVWIYFGLRRGGNSYYALDVTDIDSPKLKWIVKGGTSAFAHLEESWSAPYIANIREGAAGKKPVVIFTGGNDPEKMDYGSGDAYTPSDVRLEETTNTANGVYIVDAKTGAKLWDIHDTAQSGISDVATKLTHGIPGGARILDVSRNGILDRLYFADTGGFVWRLDLDESLGTGSVLTEFASLGGVGTNAAGKSTARKFYNEPDVGILRGNGKTMFSVSVGSGIRPHPMNGEIEDHMFVLLDEAPFIPMAADADVSIEMGDLEEVVITEGESGKTVGKGEDFEGKKITEVTGKKGWRVKFGQSGEKVLASSITFEGSIIFTTLVPKVLTEGDLISVCAAPATQGRLYAMDLLTGEASMDLDESGDEPNDNDVFVTISASEIPGTPQRVFNSLNCVNGSCKHDVDVRIGKKSTEAGTTNVEAIESVYWNSPDPYQ